MSLNPLVMFLYHYHQSSVFCWTTHFKHCFTIWWQKPYLTQTIHHEYWWFLSAEYASVWGRSEPSKPKKRKSVKDHSEPLLVIISFASSSGSAKKLYRDCQTWFSGALETENNWGLTGGPLHECRPCAKTKSGRKRSRSRIQSEKWWRSVCILLLPPKRREERRESSCKLSFPTCLGRPVLLSPRVSFKQLLAESETTRELVSLKSWSESEWNNS